MVEENGGHCLLEAEFKGQWCLDGENWFVKESCSDLSLLMFLN